jgi:hypothetical protein
LLYLIEYDGGRAWCLSLGVRERTAITQQYDWEVVCQQLNR